MSIHLYIKDNIYFQVKNRDRSRDKNHNKYRDRNRDSDASRPLISGPLIERSLYSKHNEMIDIKMFELAKAFPSKLSNAADKKTSTVGGTYTCIFEFGSMPAF